MKANSYLRLPIMLAHDAWFRARAQEALDDPRPGIPHKKVEAHVARRRAAAQQKSGAR